MGGGFRIELRARAETDGRGRRSSFDPPGTGTTAWVGGGGRGRVGGDVAQRARCRARACSRAACAWGVWAARKVAAEAWCCARGQGEHGATRRRGEKGRVAESPWLGRRWVMESTVRSVTAAATAAPAHFTLRRGGGLRRLISQRLANRAVTDQVTNTSFCFCLG